MNAYCTVHVTDACVVGLLTVQTKGKDLSNVVSLICFNHFIRMVQNNVDTKKDSENMYM